MTRHPDHGFQVQTAEVVLPAAELAATLAFFTAKLAFKVEAIHPADDPTVAVISGYGLRIRLQPGCEEAPGTLRLLCTDTDETELVAPNGTRIQLVRKDPELELPQLKASFVLSRMTAAAAWQAGRAGMQYRDLIPDRQGGRFIASHIRIPDGGTVPDYVHFHKVHFQMIYCYKGWVRVVYEDQGAPFVLRAGDCVLQPPQIRHRVLESSPGLEVIEIGCPAEHETCADHELDLPTPTVRSAREFGGQKFVRHEAADADWQAWQEGFESRDIGIEAATRGLASARVVRVRGAAATNESVHSAELLFRFVLQGTANLHCDGLVIQQLAAGDAFVVPAGISHKLDSVSAEMEFLAVTCRS